MSDKNMTIGEAIKQARKNAGMTQKQLAEKCAMADSAIRKYESGRIVPKIKTIEKIANALCMTTSDFISENDHNERFYDEREFYAIRDATSQVRRKIKIEQYENPGKIVDFATRKKWIYDLAPSIAKKYAISEETIKNASETIDFLATDIHIVTNIDDLPEHHRQIIDLMDSLNETGQRVAVARVEELAQIPKYQKAAGGNTQSVGEEPAGLDDKEPTEK